MKSPFYFDAAIVAWRASFEDTAVGSGNNLTELETHLRDSFAALTSRGLAEEEAFHLACRRLGGADLAKEFAKLNPQIIWAERAKWMFLGILSFAVFSSGLRAIRSLVAAAIVQFDASGNVMIWNLWLTALATVGLGAVVFLQIANGRWPLSLPKNLTFLRHPAALAILLCGLIIVSWSVAMLPFSVGKQGPQVIGKLAVTRNYIELGVALIMPVLLAFAVRIAQRRANPAT